MSFISIDYIIFFSVFIPIYFLLPQRGRIWLLLIASYIFYSFARVEYLAIIIFTTLVDFFAGIALGNTPIEDKAKRRGLLALSLTMNLGTLFIFKYFNFFSGSVEAIFAQFGLSYQPPIHHLILPIGVSFYTFQSIAYTVDVFRSKTKPERDIVTFAAYVSFFPQLVAGPIERPAHFLPQFHEKHKLDYERIASGLRLILWGVFKKVVIADRLAVYVNAVYNHTSDYSGLPLLVATVFFTFQIYCDFSGYSDIAIGSARILGFDLMENFHQPYLASSIRDFWRRWHISLSTWFRDYLYIPLGGNRVSFGRNLLNLMIVFVVSGLWHGASWTFIAWGAIHGLLIVLETIVERWWPSSENPALPLKLASMALTFALVVFAWIFFRANSIQDAGYVIGHMLDFSAGRSNLLVPFFDKILNPRLEFLISVGLIAGLMLVEYAFANWQGIGKVKQILLVRWIWYYAAFLLIVFSLIDIANQSPFIYFQF